MRVLLFPQATKVIKLILSKLNEMGLQGKSTIPLARLELRISDTQFSVLNVLSWFVPQSLVTII